MVENIIIKQVIAVQNAIRSGEVVKYRLAKASDVPRTTLIGVEKDGWNPNARTLAALIGGLDRLKKEKKKPPSRK
jgi:DNA-binding XRE family transcriptional regulator